VPASGPTTVCRQNCSTLAAVGNVFKSVAVTRKCGVSLGVAAFLLNQREMHVCSHLKKRPARLVQMGSPALNFFPCSETVKIRNVDFPLKSMWSQKSAHPDFCDWILTQSYFFLLPRLDSHRFLLFLTSTTGFSHILTFSFFHILTFRTGCLMLCLPCWLLSLSSS
jgi:hypothetical protein